MCIICVEWEAGKLTSKEAFRNIGEVVVKSDAEAKHFFDLTDRILEKDLGAMKDLDEELDAAWHSETHED